MASILYSLMFQLITDLLNYLTRRQIIGTFFYPLVAAGRCGSVWNWAGNTTLLYRWCSESLAVPKTSCASIKGHALQPSVNPGFGDLWKSFAINSLCLSAAALKMIRFSQYLWTHLRSSEEYIDPWKRLFLFFSADICYHDSSTLGLILPFQICL